MSEAVQKMFASIAKRYDLANDVLSFGIHHLWRKKAVRSLGMKPGSLAVDLCTGTGDLAFALQAETGGTVRVIGIDFVPEMLELAREKAKRNGVSNVLFVRGDAMKLGLKAGCAEGAMVSFGIRNVDDPLECLRGVRSVLKPGSKIAILEFGQPENRLFATVYWAYARYLLPLIGAVITGNREAYEYLPRTSQAFPSGRSFTGMLREAGFENASYSPLFFGIAYLYTASA